LVCALAVPVRERTSELAVFKAVGFPDFLLLFPVLAESLLIAVIGGTLGLILPSLAMPFLVKALNGMFPNLILAPRTILFGLNRRHPLGHSQWPTPRPRPQAPANRQRPPPRVAAYVL
jgi:hypothetical protein